MGVHFGLGWNFLRALPIARPWHYIRRITCLFLLIQEDLMIIKESAIQASTNDNGGGGPESASRVQQVPYPQPGVPPRQMSSISPPSLLEAAGYFFSESVGANMERTDGA